MLLLPAARIWLAIPVSPMVLLWDNLANVAAGDRSIGRWEQMMVGLLRFRFAAGVCVLAAGLLMGAGGAVAVADPGSNGSAAHGDVGTNASGQPDDSTGAKKPKDAKQARRTRKSRRATGATPSDNRRHHPIGHRRHHTSDTGATTPSDTGATTSDNRRHHIGHRRHHIGHRRHHIGNRRHHIGHRRHHSRNWRDGY